MLNFQIQIFTEAQERLEKFINENETPSKSKLVMTPVLNSLLKASKLNNENDSLYSYNSLQEAKFNKKLQSESDNKGNANFNNSITHDKIYEYDEDIKDASSDNEKDEVFETESSSDEIIDINNGKRKSSSNFKLRNKYKGSDTETELDLRYSSNSESESDGVYEYESGDSGEDTYYINDNKKSENQDNNYYNNNNNEYQQTQALSLRRKSRKSLIAEEHNNKNSSTYLIENDNIENNIDLPNEFEDVSNSTSEMSIAADSVVHTNNNEVQSRKSEVEINNVVINQNNKNVDKNTHTEKDKNIINNEVINHNENQHNEISKLVSTSSNINSVITENIDYTNDIMDNNDIDIPNDLPDYTSNDLPNDNEPPIDINNNEDNLSDKSDKENINDKEINIQINIPILKTNTKSSKSKRKGKSSITVSSKRKRYEEDEEEEVPIRKSSRKRIPPCKYWVGERPEDYLGLNEEEIKEKHLKIEQEEEEQNQWMRKKRRRTKKTIKKEEDNEKRRPPVSMIDASTSPIKGLGGSDIIDYSMSLSRDYKTEFTAFDVKTNKLVKQSNFFFFSFFL